MFRSLTPTSIHPPFSAYSHGAAIETPARVVFCSGQLGIAADGAIAVHNRQGRDARLAP